MQYCIGLRDVPLPSYCYSALHNKIQIEWLWLLYVSVTNVCGAEHAVNVVGDPDLDWPTAVPEMESTEIPVLMLPQIYFHKIKCGDLRALSSHGRFTDVQCSHLIARSPCDFCPKRHSIHMKCKIVDTTIVWCQTQYHNVDTWSNVLWTPL